MRRAGDRVADPRRPPLSRDGGRGAGVCRALPVRQTIGRPFMRTSDCPDRGMQTQRLPLAPRGRRRPASCGPNAEPPFRARVLRRAPLSRRIPQGLGDARLSHTPPRPGNAPRSRNDLAQSSEWRSRGVALGESVPGRQRPAASGPSSPRGAWQGRTISGLPPVGPVMLPRGISRRLTAAARRWRLRADPRGAPPICGRSEPPSCSGAGLLCGGTAGVTAVSPSPPAQSSAETPKATAKPNVVTRPTALPPRR